MVKEKVDNVNLAKQQALEQENIILKNKVDQLEKSTSEMQNALGDSLSNEMKKIRMKGKSSANRIEITEKNDHRNIYLWTKWGKPLGPMHPDNAVQTLNRFADIGVRLTVDRPTSEQLEAWSNSTEGKEYFRKEKAKRDIKDKSRRGGQMEKLAAEIARMSGTTVDAINHILKAHEVKK